MSDNKQPDDTDNPWKTHSSRLVYENPWIRVREDKVTTPTGSDGIYGVVEFKHRAVGVVPIADNGDTWLVGQYRYAPDNYEWEIPEGGCPSDETPAETALRELREETGLDAGNIKLLLGDIQLSNSVSDERAWLFVATELTSGDMDPDETEQLGLRLQ